MSKKMIERKERTKILYILNKLGINDDVITIAKKMGLDIENMIYDKVIKNGSEENFQVASKSLLGVYGNYLATKHFKDLGYIVKNEVPIRNKIGITVTNADLEFIDNENIKNYCEVKATAQIIDNIRNYKDPITKEKQGSFEDKDDEILKYKCIGKKLIKQVSKLSKKDAKINVIVFKNCYIDNIIKEKLNSLDANIIALEPNIEVLEKDMDKKIEEINKHFNNSTNLE